ncbi:MAG: L-threonylcarbamoyladenylate synthase [Candidatus Methanoperedens sp.]|nr:L-threonylcarbamoyladenylate synthase [Candidatus Methanoperedens sp.]
MRKAAEIIRAGGTVAFPTETVYGLGADALNSDAVAKIFKAKNRPADNPLIVHVSCIEMLNMVAREVPPAAEDLMTSFWPGPLTIVLKRRSIVPDIVTCGLDTVAVRMPAHDTALALIKEAGVPIAAPSANLSGRPSPTRAEHVINDMEGRIDAVIQGEESRIGIESTVIDLTVKPPALLRPGGLGLEDIIEVIGEAEVSGDPLRSPGMRYTHYSPKTRLVLVEGRRECVLSGINRLLQKYREQGLKAGVLASKESAPYIECNAKYVLGSVNDLEEVASRLFLGLRFLDEADLDIGIAEGVFPEIREGRAIMNRLRKAAEETLWSG